MSALVENQECLSHFVVLQSNFDQKIEETFVFESSDKAYDELRDSETGHVALKMVKCLSASVQDKVKEKLKDCYSWLQVQSVEFLGGNETDLTPKWRPKLNDCEYNFRSHKMEVLKKYEEELMKHLDESEKELAELEVKRAENMEKMEAAIKRCHDGEFDEVMPQMKKLNVGLKLFHGLLMKS